MEQVSGGPGITPGPPRVVELIRVRIPLVVPFTTAQGTMREKDALLVRVENADGVVGWGECGAQATPGYSDETIDVAYSALRSGSFDGRPFARAALDAAWLDGQLRAAGVSLAFHLGGTRTHVEAGVAIGIADDVVEQASAYADAGYRRIKLKLAPDVPFEIVRDVRAVVGPGVALQADANESFTLADADRLAALADYDLQCIEQPLPRAAIADHAELARRIATPICLDESITSATDARDAIRAGACSIVNIKPGRLGGLVDSVAVHDVCVAEGAAALCGGMLETGLGRAVNVALATLPGFTVAGDLSASDRYFAEDLTDPFVLDDGMLAVPTGPGSGVVPREDVLDRYTVSRERL